MVERQRETIAAEYEGTTYRRSVYFGERFLVVTFMTTGERGVKAFGTEAECAIHMSKAMREAGDDLKECVLLPAHVSHEEYY